MKSKMFYACSILRIEVVALIYLCIFTKLVVCA